MVEISKGGWLIAIDLPGWNTRALRSERWMNNATDGSTCGTLGIPIEKFPMHFGSARKECTDISIAVVCVPLSEPICTNMHVIHRWSEETEVGKPEKYPTSMLQRIPFHRGRNIAF